ncbi:lactate dehydrogenase, partial [Candidatus Bipolaricaulota bacterium]|nr:lactate dehydrogenase [Candidatus Bipolaricaulota bacterium]
MDIAVIGASGDVGRQIAQQVVAERLLDRSETLTLVGNPEGSSARSTYGLAADLTDAYAEIVPIIDVVLDPSRIRSDLIVAAAGATPKPSLGTPPLDRDGLAAANAKIFQRYAQAIAQNGHGHEIVVCIANPVELGVAIFAKHLGRQRVVGMGAFLDSLRFRQEIGASLGIRRERIHAFVAGEHGSLSVPLWSGVHVYGYSDTQLAQALETIRKGVNIDTLWEAIAQAQARIASLIQDGKVQEAYALVEQYPPDVRVVIRPFVTHYSGAKT